MNGMINAVENNLGLASQCLLILHYVITETHTTLILVHLAGQMAITVSIFVTAIIFTAELSLSFVEEEPLYSGEKRVLLKTISNQNNHGKNQAQLVLELRLSDTNSGCVAGSESHAYRLSALPASKESK